MFFRPTIQVELDQEDKAVKEIYIRGEAPPQLLSHLPASAPPPAPPRATRPEAASSSLFRRLEG